MPAFPKPSFDFPYSPNTEIDSLRNYRDSKPGRQIPDKQSDRLLLGSWNIANLGLQERRQKDYQVLAEVVSWFDVIAIQEVNDDLSGLNGLMAELPGHYKTIFSDKAGNNERAAYIFDSTKVSQLEMVGEIAIPPKDNRFIKIKGVTQTFKGFDRNPFLVTFEAGSFRFVLANVHLYFGSESSTDMGRRSLEAYAISRWADLRSKSKNTFVRDIIPLGDFNIPKVEPGDPIYDALKKRGLQRPKHSTKIYSNISNDKDYDQIVFLPGQTKEEFTGKIGVFDFDGAVFSSLFSSTTPSKFRSYVKYYLSDHRPIWAEFKI